jgi:uncharacterized protein (TIGR03437 family)
LDVVVNHFPRGVTVILGNGDGTFQNSIEISDPASKVLAVVDFNGDGRPDLLVETSDGPSLSVLLNSTPALVLEPPVISATGFTTPRFAPGMLVTIKGAFLSDAIRAARPPLPDEMGDTTVRVNGIRAPLYYVSPSQINLQIPFELPAGHGTLEVDRGAGRLLALDLDFSEFAPAIFTTNQMGTGAAVGLHRDATLVSDESPAKLGETISGICTGLGRVNPAVPSGTAALDPPPTTVAIPEVTIAGLPTVVRFSGLAAGYAGVYRVDIDIPDGAPKGGVPLRLSIGGIAANPVSLPVN